MSVSAGMSRMERARKDLLAEWSRTRQAWRDTMAERFEATYLEPADADLRQTVSAMEQLAASLHRVRRECE